MARIDVTIKVQATRDTVRQVLQRVPQDICRRNAVTDAMMTRCGLSLLDRISKAYVIKSRGGVDEAGERWTPLSPRTLYAKRRKPRMGSPQSGIMRDTGLLLKSLTPGSGIPPGQILRVERGRVTVGTSVPYAILHHRGIPGKLPRRRLWAPSSNWPNSWWEEITENIKRGIVDAIDRLVRDV